MDVYSIHEWILIAQLFAAAVLLGFFSKTWGLTGLLIGLRAALYQFAINSEIVPALYMAGKMTLIPTIFIGVDALFLLLLVSRNITEGAWFRLGKQGAPLQKLLLSLMVISHVVMFSRVMEPPFSVGWVFDFSVWFSGSSGQSWPPYTILMVVLHALQVLVLHHGINSGYTAGCAFMGRFFHRWRSGGSGSSIAGGASK